MLMLRWRSGAPCGAGFCVAVAMAATLLLPLVVSAQSGRSYGPGHIWWEAGQGGALPWEETYDNPDGQVSILNRAGAVRTDHHPFFESLGVNGRACVTCHQPSNAMSISAATLRERWKETEGRDPVFAAVDGSNCPDLPQAAESSHSLLLERGLFRIFLPWPPRGVRPEFRIDVVRDPSGCNTGSQSAGSISVYRRPRIAANLVTVVAGPQGPSFMADGREPSLTSQAIGAIMVHEQAATHPTLEQLRGILEFETQVYAAQSADIRGGLLNEKDGPAALGPQNLAAGRAGSLEAALSFESWRKPKGTADLDYSASSVPRWRAEAICSPLVARTATPRGPPGGWTSALRPARKRPDRRTCRCSVSRAIQRPLPSLAGACLLHARSGAGVNFGQVRGRGRDRAPAVARPGRARSVFFERLGAHAPRSRQLLRPAFRDPVYRTGEAGLGELSAGAVSSRPPFNSRRLMP